MKQSEWSEYINTFSRVISIASIALIIEAWRTWLSWRLTAANAEAAANKIRLCCCSQSIAISLASVITSFYYLKMSFWAKVDYIKCISFVFHKTNKVKLLKQKIQTLVNWLHIVFVDHEYIEKIPRNKKVIARECEQPAEIWAIFCRQKHCQYILSKYLKLNKTVFFNWILIILNKLKIKHCNLLQIVDINTKFLKWDSEIGVECDWCVPSPLDKLKHKINMKYWIWMSLKYYNTIGHTVALVHYTPKKKINHL